MSLLEAAPPAKRINFRANARKRCFDYLVALIRAERPMPAYFDIAIELGLWEVVISTQYELMLAEGLIARETEAGNVRWAIEGFGATAWARLNPGSRGKAKAPPKTRRCMSCRRDFASDGKRVCPRCTRRGE
jgi:uncharacterized paraquat-inducible protein A